MRGRALVATRRAYRIPQQGCGKGLLNRRGFIRRAESLLADRSPIALILLDLDRFKPINDAHGHQAGDEVLKAVAHVLSRARLSKSMPVGRLGGEEFGILMEAHPGRAAVFAEQLRLTLANLPIAAGGLSLSVTASFGVSGADGGRS